MANPTIERISEGLVVKVATNVTSGMINSYRKNSPGMVFLTTYRATGESAPTIDEITTEGLVLFLNSNQAKIDSSFPIDVYVSCANGDSDSEDYGKVVIWI